VTLCDRFFEKRKSHKRDGYFWQFLGAGFEKKEAEAPGGPKAVLSVQAYHPA
jgi:hypothetical protein